MNCETITANLSLYLDDALPDGERSLFDGHLDVCPVCRAEVSGMHSVLRGLRSVPRPAIPMNLSAAINDAINIEAAAVKRLPRVSPTELIKHWLQPRLMPYTVGTFASLILFAMMFVGLRSSLNTFRAYDLASRNTETRFQVSGYDVTQPVTAEHFAARRSDFSPESPSLNPQGALAALSMSTARNLGDDDMVVVADVFSNGIASLADVVQPPRDPRMLSDFQDALRKDAAFVPATYDRRPQTMRVVLVVTRVAVE